MDEKETTRPPATPGTSPQPPDVNVVPFPAARRKPALGPKYVLSEPDEFDPGPGAA